MNIRELIRKNASNIPGWHTSRKIVVIESDDWGSVRIRDLAAFQALKDYGLNVESVHYDSVEALESNQDLEYLFETLLEMKDVHGNPPKITPMCIVGNPDFKAIEASDFKKYTFQPLEDTLKEYPESDKVISLWKKGMELQVFDPQIHGREHVNVRCYMKTLQSHPAKDGLRFALKHQSFGPTAFNGMSFPNYLGALHPESKEEIAELKRQVLHAGELFESYLGKKPEVFIAPNAEEPIELEEDLQRIGVKYLTRSKKRIYPLGDGEFKKEWCFMGRYNSAGQLYLNRNAFFEPVTWGEHEHIDNWVDSCLCDMELAFRWKKPAVISTHRVNYVGSINPDNRAKGLKSLKELILKAQKKWPQIEFMSSKELGDLIQLENKKN